MFSLYDLIITVYLTACLSGIWTTMISRSFLWPSGRWANFRNCESAPKHTCTQTHLPDMIMVALSQVIPLSDFNVALGYNLSRLKQVLPTPPTPPPHTHTHWSACMHTKFFSTSADVSSVNVCQRASACLHLIYPKKKKNAFQLCNGRCNMRTSDCTLAHKHTIKKNHPQAYAKSKTRWETNITFLYLQRIP